MYLATRLIDNLSNLLSNGWQKKLINSVYCGHWLLFKHEMEIKSKWSGIFAWSSNLTAIMTTHYLFINIPGLNITNDKNHAHPIPILDWFFN